MADGAATLIIIADIPIQEFSGWWQNLRVALSQSNDYP